MWGDIAATLFLRFMEKNGLLHRPDGSKRITDATLVALTLMIAESRLEEKDMMVRGNLPTKYTFRFLWIGGSSGEGRGCN